MLSIRRKMMKKIILLTLTMCLFALLFAGCGKKEEKIQLGTYKGLKYQNQVIEAKDEEIDKLVESLRDQFITYKALPDRIETPVRTGDILNIDYEGVLDGQTTPFQGGSEKGAHLEIGSGRFIAGFEDGLIGKTVGETVVLNLTFPDQYYAEYAGKKVNFTVKINAVEKKIIPDEVTDAMVEEYTEGLFKTVTEYRDYAKQYIIDQKTSSFKTKLKEELMNQIISSTKFEKLDEKKLDEYYGNLINYYTTAASGYGLTLTDYIDNYYGKSADEFYAEVKSIAEQTMKKELVLAEIISKEKITLTEEQYNTLIKDYMERYGYDSQADFEAAYTVDKIRQSMLYDLAMELIVNNAVAE